MTKFAKSDWVQIVPSPDTRSDVWTSDHNKFCGKVGEIIDTNEFDKDMPLFRVSVYFNYKKPSIYGYHSAWFEDKHVILSSKWEADRATYLNEEYERYMRTESNMKKRRDELLKKVFTVPEEPKKEKVDLSKKEYEYDPSEDGWVFGGDWYMKDPDSD
jgi:hypothetical protein